MNKIKSRELLAKEREMQTRLMKQEEQSFTILFKSSIVICLSW